jgi:peptide/nickel transport system permease protein
VSLLAATGVNISSLLAGTFVVEFIFDIPGLGFELVRSIDQRDYIVVQGIVLVVAVAVVAINFIVDFLFTVVDPRIARD